MAFLRAVVFFRQDEDKEEGEHRATWIFQKPGAYAPHIAVLLPLIVQALYLAF